MELLEGEVERALEIYLEVAEDADASEEDRARAWLRLATAERRRGNLARFRDAVERAAQFAEPDSTTGREAARLLAGWEAAVSVPDRVDWLEVYRANAATRSHILELITDLAVPVESGSEERQRELGARVNASRRQLEGYGLVALPLVRRAHAQASGAFRADLAEVLFSLGDWRVVDELVRAGRGSFFVGVAQRRAADDPRGELERLGRFLKAHELPETEDPAGRHGVAFLRLAAGDLSAIVDLPTKVPAKSITAYSLRALNEVQFDRAELERVTATLERVPPVLVSVIVRQYPDGDVPRLLERAARDCPEGTSSALLQAGKFASLRALLERGHEVFPGSWRTLADRNDLRHVVICHALQAGREGKSLPPEVLPALAQVAREFPSEADLVVDLIRAQWALTPGNPYWMRGFDPPRPPAINLDNAAELAPRWIALARECPEAQRVDFVRMIAPDLPGAPEIIDAISSWWNVTPGELPPTDLIDAIVVTTRTPSTTRVRSPGAEVLLTPAARGLLGSHARRIGLEFARIYRQQVTESDPYRLAVRRLPQFFSTEPVWRLLHEHASDEAWLEILAEPGGMACLQAVASGRSDMTLLDRLERLYALSPGAEVSFALGALWGQRDRFRSLAADQPSERRGEISTAALSLSPVEFFPWRASMSLQRIIEDPRADLDLRLLSFRVFPAASDETFALFVEQRPDAFARILRSELEYFRSRPLSVCAGRVEPWIRAGRYPEAMAFVEAASDTARLRERLSSPWLDPRGARATVSAAFADPSPEVRAKLAMRLLLPELSPDEETRTRIETRIDKLEAWLPRREETDR